VIRVAAVGDLHAGLDSKGSFAACAEGLAESADCLLLAGDLTRVGDPAEARVLAEDLARAEVPVVAVLGNHDHHTDRADQVVDILAEVGVTVLEGSSTVVEVGEWTLGIAGVKGFGGGFAGACATAFGEPAMKAFVRHTEEVAAALERELCDLRTDVRIALTHYAPTDTTLRGERLEIYPFLGSFLLGEAIDRAGCELAVHGHAHAGCERGVTAGGGRVRNVAQPVLRRGYAVYSLTPSQRVLPV
jgi:Icc-related predicted phosphoesterase